MTALGALAALSIGAVLEVPAGAPLASALASARAGDVVRLGPGRHDGALGSPAGIRIEGAGAEATRVIAPPGEPGAIVRGRVAISGLALEAGPAQCALKVLGGDVALDDVLLSGGGCGAFVDGGRLDGRAVTLRGEHGLLLASGEVSLRDGSARGGLAALAVLGGTLSARRVEITGPSADGGVSVARGTAHLEDVVVRAPGPTGLSVHHGGRLEGLRVIVAGTEAEGGFLGACVQVTRASLRLEASTLARCAGTAVEASGGEVDLRAVDATGGSAGCFVLVNGAAGRLEGNVCAGHGPGLVVDGRSRATLIANRWRTSPEALVDCDGGAQVEIGRGEGLARPCRRRP
jgi:hypothetical protein